MKSGWCTGPAGARVRHDWCRFNLCQCACHGENPQAGLGKLLESGAQSGPESALTDRGLATSSTTPNGA